MVVIKIFDAKDTNFNTAGNIIIEPLYCHEIKKKSLNGWYIDVEIPINYKNYIEQDKLCVVQTKSKLNPQAFRIKNIEYTTNKIVFQAQHVMFDAEDYFLLDSRPTNQNGLNALTYINEMTDKVSPFVVHSNVENTNTAYFIRKNLLEAWAIIEERWGGVFDADNWNISFLTSVGNDNGETIYYGKNLENMKIMEDWSGVCTKLYPVGKDEIMLADKYLESTTQYDIPYTRTISFDTELSDEEQTEENLLSELETNAINYLQENCVPKVCYEISSNINQNMEIGDTIAVKHPLCNISTEVLEYEYDVILEKITKLVFGNYSKDVKKKFKAVTNTIESIKEAVSKQQTTINNQTELINSLNKNGYVYIDENEILLLDALPKEKAKNVWRFGLAGIGYSSNGYEGPFEVAITMDGQINANFITTGTMSVSRIEGLANFISETEKQIAEIEIEQGNITSRVSSVETTANTAQTTANNAQATANTAQTTADSAIEGITNIVTTQGEAEGKSIHIEDSAEEPFVDITLHGESTQEGTPTPDSPVEIENITGDVEVKVEGKNRFDKSKDFTSSNISKNLWAVTQIENGLRVMANYSDGAPYIRYVVTDLSNYIGKTVRAKANFVASSTNKGNYRLVLCNKDGSNATVKASGSGNINNEISFIIETLEEERKCLALDLFSNSSGTQSPTAYVDYTDIIVTIDDEDMTYEPYKSQTETFPLGEEKLMKGSYLDDEGIHHSRGQVVFDGTETWSKDDNKNLETDYFWIRNTGITQDNVNSVICNYFEKSTGVVQGVWATTVFCITINKTATGIVSSDTKDQRVAKFKSWLATQYANGTPVIVEYDLAEPETVPYTAEQQEAWEKIKALTTYKNITNITSTAYAKITYMRDNGLDVYETKQNAQKKYTETSEKLTEQKMTVDGVITQVSETNKRLTNDYLTAEQVNAELGTTKEDIEIIKQNQVTMTQTSKDLQIAIDTINNEGVSKVKTSMGYTFDDEGFKLNRSNAETGTIIDEAAVKVIDKTGASEQNLLYAGYVKEGNTEYPSYIGQTIVASANMIVKNYLVVPNSRYEAYENPVLGGKGTGAFGI